MTSETQTATLPAENVWRGKNLSGEKELVAAYNLLVIRQGHIHHAVSVRCWMGRSSNASVVYATIWTFPAADGPCMWLSGHGKAGGYGYDKKSAAIAAAIKDAGITLSRDIAGVGHYAVQDALRAIGEAMGFDLTGSAIITN